VDEELGLVRMSRVVGAYDAGKIINPRTARSQTIGGLIWGIGQALLEQSETDPNLDRFLHRNLSGYLVPTNADSPELDVIFAGELDTDASPLGSKGSGELTAVSVAPAHSECGLSRRPQTHSGLTDQRREAGVPVRAAGSRNYLDYPDLHSRISH
jgi:xanthine dehydrogenase molybdopterin-binding subunit B